MPILILTRIFNPVLSGLPMYEIYLCKKTIFLLLFLIILSLKTQLNLSFLNILSSIIFDSRSNKSEFNDMLNSG